MLSSVTRPSRVITHIEQTVHSGQKTAPLTGLAIVCLAHRNAIVALFDTDAHFVLAPRDPPMPVATVVAVLVSCALLGVAPCPMELASRIPASRKRTPRASAGR